MEGFYFFVKFALVLIYILKVYRRNILLEFIDKKNVQFITCILLLKSMYLLKLSKTSLLKI